MRLSGNACDTVCRRLQMLFQVTLDFLPGIPQQAAGGSYFRIISALCDGLERTVASYPEFDDAYRKRVVDVQANNDGTLQNKPSIGRRLRADPSARVGARLLLKTKRWTKQIMMIFLSPEHHQVTLEIRLVHLANLVPIHERGTSVEVSILAWDKHGE